jgi:hypothetical protein
LRAAKIEIEEWKIESKLELVHYNVHSCGMLQLIELKSTMRYIFFGARIIFPPPELILKAVFWRPSRLSGVAVREFALRKDALKSFKSTSASGNGLY